MRHYILATLAALLLGAGTLAVLRLRQPPPPAIHAVTEEMLLAADTAGAWLTYGRDFTNQRYAPFTQIDRRNVTRLTSHRLSPDHTASPSPATLARMSNAQS